MSRYHLLFLVFVTPFYFVCFIFDAFAEDAESVYSTRRNILQPRIEAGGKIGTERSLGMMEGWVPLAQGDDNVLYSDIRWMADNRETREGNLGAGYRQMTNDKDAIIGVHGWIDRRRTDRGSTFYQITGGMEYLKENWDTKMNIYMPLNKEKTYTTPNTGSEDPYLAGTGIYYDTNGKIVEESLPGFDMELGYRIPALENDIDSIRVYGGGYAFKGNKVDDVIGGRVRASLDINPVLNIGTRFQYDEARGSQSFLEATFRFPFSAKKRYQTHKLRARLDESPERDVDIVTRSVIADTGLEKPILSVVNKDVQRVFHVDNTANAGGDGSLDNPFNTLQAADTAADREGDVIYVHSGSGINGLDHGVILSHAKQSLLGEGSNFIYDGQYFTTSTGDDFSGTLLRPAGIAPTITNSVGDGVTVTADDIMLSGFSVSDAAQNGIKIHNASQTRIENVSTYNNGRNGVYLLNDDGQTRSLDTRDISTGSNAENGIKIESAGDGSYWDNIDLTDIHADANGQRGILIEANNSGEIGTVTLDQVSVNNHAHNSSGRGLEIKADGADSTIATITAAGITATGNSQFGVFVNAVNAGTIGRADVAAQTSQQSMLVEAGSSVTNGPEGIYVLAPNSVDVNAMEFSGNPSGVHVSVENMR